MFEIFSSTSDQAKLITTLITAVIAIVAILVNQWFNTKRARKSKLIEKIEEAYLSIIKLDEISSSVHFEIVSNYHKYEINVHDYPYKDKAFHEIETPELLADILNYDFYRVEATAYMLSGLYFPNLKNDIKIFKETYQDSYRIFVSSESLSEYIKDSKEARLKMKDIIQKLYDNLSSIMNKQLG